MSRFVTYVCIGLLSLPGSPAFAQALDAVQVDIAAQPVGDALNQFAEQSGLQVVLYADDAEGIEVAAVAGEFEHAGLALDTLLASTGLEYSFINERTVAVTADKDDEAEDSGNSRTAPRPVMTAQASEEANEDTTGRNRASSPSSDGKDSRIEEVVVTGSRLKGIADAGPAPVTIISREQIDETGASTVADVFKYVSQQSYTFSEERNFGAAQHVELRGIGADTTLVLINGRRTVPSAANVASNAFDLNSIPLAAVERVEILSDSASAVYGADAVGGVVNIITKSEITRPAAMIQYGGAEGGAEELRMSASHGLAKERLRASLSLDYFERDYLLGAERDRYADQDFTRFAGGIDRRSTATNPANITSRSTANLPGLPSGSAAVPIGSTGIDLSPSDFLATAGQTNRVSLGSYQSIIPEAQRYSAVITTELDLRENFMVFGELFYNDRTTRSRSSPSSLSDALVPALNPFNPFGVDVSASYLFTGIGPRQNVIESTLYRGVAGLRGDIGAWEWESSVLATTEEGASWTENAVDSARVSAALSATDPMQALNVFQDGPGGSPDLLNSLIAEPTVSDYQSDGTQVSAFVRGSPWSIPAGPLDIVLGGEWRREDIFFDSGSTFVSDDRTVSAAFGEVRVPILGADRDARLLNEVTLTLAGRYDEYSDFGGAFNPQAGLVWRPISDVTLRASYGTSFRAPALFELYAPRRGFSGISVTDPRRNNETASIVQFTGGNPDLESVEGKSSTAGIIYTPSMLPDLRLSASYWRIELDRRVSTFSAQLVLANESQFPERVVRQDPTPADISAGLPGALISIDGSRINFGELKTSGIDIAVAYGVDTSLGRVDSRLSATWVDRYTTVQTPGSAEMNRIGIYSREGSIPRWRGVWALTFARDAFALSCTARYVSAYDAATFAGVRTGRVLPAQTLVDVQASVDLGELLDNPGAVLSRATLTVGANNIFDKAPSFLETATSGYDLQGDFRQRFVYVRLAKSF